MDCIKLNVLVICDGDDSSATTVMKNIVKHSKHNLRIVQWFPDDIKDVDIIYVHYGGLFWPPHKKLINFLIENRDVKWIAGIRGFVNFKRWLNDDLKTFCNFVYYFDAISTANKMFVGMVDQLDSSLRTFVCHVGIDNTLFTPQPLTDDFCIGWAGNIYCGSKMFFNFARLPFVKKTAGGGLGTWRNYKEMPKFYKEISVYVSSSTEEGGPLPPKEAAASGRPVVAVKTGDLSEWMPEEWLVPNYDDSWKLLIPKIEQLRNDKELYLKECKRFQELILNWDYSIIVKEYDLMFEEVMK